MDTPLDFFGLPAQLAALQQPVADPASEVQRLVKRAWYLRQRNTGAALADAKTAQDLLSTLGSDAAQRASGRLTLVRAENAWLFGDLDRARSLIDEARQIFQWAQDPVGLGDTYLSESGLMEPRGAGRQLAIRAAGAAYRNGTGGGDPLRLLLADTWAASLELLPPAGADPTAWFTRLEQGAQPGHAGLDLFVQAALATLAGQRGQPGEAIDHLHNAFQAAHTAGQLFWAIALAQDIALGFSGLHDHEGALQWVQRALALVQPTGWPYAAGRCLVQAAAVQLAMDRPQAARDQLMACMPTLQRFAVSPNYVWAAQVLGEALLALRDPQDAVAWIEVSERIAHQLRMPDLVSSSLRLKALALSQLGRADEALAAAQAALQLTRDKGDPLREAGMLHVMAQIARSHGLALLADSPEATALEVNAALHHLREAFALAERVPGHGVPPSWHAELSLDHEAIGDLAQALRHQRLAAAAADQVHRTQAAELVTALRARQRIEAMWEQAERQRAHEQAGHQRATLQEAERGTLERLAVIQQELLRGTDTASVFATLDRHVGVLLDARSIAVWRLGGRPEPTQMLELAWGVEDDQPMPPATLPASDTGSLPWQCLGSQQLLHAAVPRDGPDPRPGSALLVPLTVAEHALGVLAVMSPQADAYRERERHILLVLGAALSQALAGLAGAERLRQAQTELEHERLHSLFMHTGKTAAVAGLASRVVKGMSLPLAHLAELAGALAADLEQRRLPGPAAGARSMHHEAERLEQISLRLRGFIGNVSPKLAQHDLRSVFDDARSLFGARLATEHIACDESVADLTVQADTERLSLTIANLVFNAVDAMQGRSHKQLWLSAEQRDGEIALSVRDNGPGLPGDVAARLFEPFFSTKPEGLGLGLDARRPDGSGDERTHHRGQRQSGWRCHHHCFALDLNYLFLLYTSTNTAASSTRPLITCW